MKKERLVEILRQGVHNKDLDIEDHHRLTFEGEYAICTREWLPPGEKKEKESSRAKVRRNEMDEFLDYVVEMGKGEVPFNSINSFKLHGMSVSDYDGQVLVKISIRGDEVEYKVSPTPLNMLGVKMYVPSYLKE